MRRARPPPRGLPSRLQVCNRSMGRSGRESTSKAGTPLPRRLVQRPALARVCEGAELTDEAGARGSPEKDVQKVYIVGVVRVIPSPSPSLEAQWPQRMTKANRSRTHAELVERAWGARDLAKEADDARRGEERTAEVMVSPGGRFRSPRRSDQRLFSRFKRPEKC